MPRNLSDQATTQADHFRDRLASARTALGAAQEDLDRRGDPDSVEPGAWHQELGAEQYLKVAVGHLEQCRATEEATRSQAQGATPEQLEALRPMLSDALMASADALVLVRHAIERLQQARSTKTSASALVARATDRLAAASAWETEAKATQAAHDGLRSSLAAPPVSTVTADASAMLAGSVVSDARDRLQELLPATLFDRAAARANEARRREARAAEVFNHADEVNNSVLSSRAGTAGGSRAARLRMERAEAEVATYVRRAAGALDRATDLLTPIASLADLDPVVAGALDENDADNDAAKDAAGLEQALADALATLDDRQADVDAAVLAALAEDPDRDPHTEGGVQAAVAARDDASVQNPLAQARADYDEAARTALSRWEAEVPPWLWAAARDYFDAVGMLQQLADGTSRQAMLDAWDESVDALADALDTEAVATRSAALVAAEVGTRSDAADALAATADARFFDYVRGGGPGGRTPWEV
jgi:hypothetical protein